MPERSSCVGMSFGELRFLGTSRHSLLSIFASAGPLCLGIYWLLVLDVSLTCCWATIPSSLFFLALCPGQWLDLHSTSCLPLAAPLWFNQGQLPLDRMPLCRGGSRGVYVFPPRAPESVNTRTSQGTDRSITQGLCWVSALLPDRTLPLHQNRDSSKYVLEVPMSLGITG